MLIDSDVAIDLLRGYENAQRWFLGLPRTEELVISGYSVVELLDPAMNKVRQQSIQRFTSRFQMMWPSPERSQLAFEVWAKYRLSHGLGPFDALIGFTAIEYNLPLCTYNKKHFRLIPGLTLLQPYSRG